MPGLEVTLGVLAGLAAAALQTPGLAMEAEAPVVRLALVTPRPHHPGQTLTLTTGVVTLPGALSVTRARLAVLGLDGVTIEPGLAPLTAVPSSVVETELTQAGDSVTGIVIHRVNVPVTLTRLTLAIRGLWLSEVSGTTGLAPVSNIIGFTDTELVFSILGEEAVT